MAERVGFEPTVHRCITGFQDRLHKPLGHLSVTCCTILAKGAQAVNAFVEVVIAMLENRLDHGAKAAVEIFGRHLPAAFDPPQYHFDEAARDVVDEEILRHGGIFPSMRDDVQAHELLQTVLEIAQEDVAARR